MTEATLKYIRIQMKRTTLDLHCNGLYKRIYSGAGFSSHHRRIYIYLPVSFLRHSSPSLPFHSLQRLPHTPILGSIRLTVCNSSFPGSSIKKPFDSQPARDMNKGGQGKDNRVGGCSAFAGLQSIGDFPGKAHLFQFVPRVSAFKNVTED